MINRGKQVITAERTKQKMLSELVQQIEQLDEECKELGVKFDTYCRASAILGSVSDQNTTTKINAITGVINKALTILFPDDTRLVELKQTMYRNVYPHYNLNLLVEDEKKRSFKSSGTGIGQVISFLFTCCLIDARGGRKILVIDELLNGLHPDAKQKVKDLMLALSDKFQFIVVEYGMDIGKEYRLTKKNTVSTAQVYTSGTYYKDTVKDEQ